MSTARTCIKNLLSNTITNHSSGPKTHFCNVSIKGICIECYAMGAHLANDHRLMTLSMDFQEVHVPLGPTDLACFYLDMNVRL